MEAERLSVYFEEVGAYQKKKLRETQNHSPSDTPTSSEKTDFVMEDQESWVWVEEDD